MTRPDQPARFDQVDYGDGYETDDESGVPTTAGVAPATSPTTASAATGSTGAPVLPGPTGAGSAAAPTTPLPDNSAAIGAQTSGSAQGGPFSGPVQSDVQKAQSAPVYGGTQSKEARDFHDLNEHDYQQNQRFAKAVPNADDRQFLHNFGDGDAVPGISQNDLDRINFGVEEPKKITAADAAQNSGKQQLARYAQAINSGDVGAVGTAEELLKQAEPALAFFRFFEPAYALWTGGGSTYDEIKHAYEAEYGMSFTAFGKDAQTLADMSQKLGTSQQSLDNAYNALVPQWQGRAASAFEAKMAVFFTAASTVGQDTATAGKDVTALVKGLQQLVLAKAQTVSQLYATTLPNAIDGVMATTIATIGKGGGTDDQKQIAFRLLGGSVQVSFGKIVVTGGNTTIEEEGLGVLFDGGDDVRSAIEQVAPQMCADWCNNVLKPQYEARADAVNQVNAQTKTHVQNGFQAFTSGLSGVTDPFAGVEKAGAPSGSGGSSGSSGSGGSGGTGGGTGGGGSPTVPSFSTGGAGSGGSGLGSGGASGGGSGSGASGSGASGLGGGAGTAGGTGGSGAGDTTTRPAGLPAGAGWIPAGVSLPKGWTEDPKTGQVLPPGYSVDPSTGLPTQTQSAGGSSGSGSAGSGSAGVGSSGVGSSGSGSLGDGSLGSGAAGGTGDGTGSTGTTGLSGLSGLSGVGSGGIGSGGIGSGGGSGLGGSSGLSATGTGSAGVGATGVDPKDDIHKNEDGSVSLGTDRGLTISPEAGKQHAFVLHDTGADGIEHSYRVHFDGKGDPVVTEIKGAESSAMTAPSGLSGGGASIGGGGGVGGGIGSGGIGGSAHSGVAAHAASAGGDESQGMQVGADNSMSSSGAAATAGSPVAGSAAPAQGSGQQQSGFGGIPFGGARGAGAGGGEQEAGRKYARREDVVGEADLEEWQRMGPVIGEQ